MIVDSHSHLFAGQYRPKWNQVAVEHSMAAYKGVSLEVARGLEADSIDPTGEKLIAEMNAGGVDVSVVVTLDYGLALPGAENDSPVPLERQFEETAAVVKSHPGRLIWGPCIDPRRQNAVALAEMAVKKLGARVLKFYPPTGFYPDDQILRPLYKKAVESGIPVQFHVQPTSVPNLRSKFSHPVHFDDLAVDFPELKIYCVHGGGVWWSDMMAIATNRSNIFLDVGGWQSEMKRNPLECYRRVREMISRLGPKRVLWASDWIGPGLLEQAAWLKSFQRIPDAVRASGIDFTEIEKRCFLGEAARELFGI